MSEAPILPGARAAFVNPDGTPSRPFYDYLRRQSLATNGTAPNVAQLTADVVTLAQKLGADDGKPASITTPIFNFTGFGGIQATQDGHAVKLSLVDLADSGTGSFQLIERDAKGRVAGTVAGTSDDVPEGASNLYAQPVMATALTALSYPNVVALDGAGNAYYPDLTNPVDVSRIVGVTLHAAAMGAPVAIVTSRDFTETAWGWSPGRIYCALAGGTLTQTAPTSGAVIEVARVITPTTIRVGIQPATLR